jgi:meso-butanediol dehydrogenase / (S,S)-butanediol dehydrogenase / diacetyl reductase
MHTFTRKAALVTGAGGQHGIGRAVAMRLAEGGADVVVSDLVERPYPEQTPAWAGLPQIVEDIQALGRRAGAILADVTDARQVDTLVNEAMARLGRLDIFVHCAASIPGPDRVPVVDLDEQVWNSVQRINVTGTFLSCRAVARALIAQGQGGRIITLSSVSGKRGAARFAAYCASKFAVIGFTQALALELAPHRITANAICPTFVDTERITHIAGALAPAGVSAEEHRARMTEDFAASIPLGRMAWPADVAGAAAFLASDDAGYLTGLALTVAGGSVME